MRIVCLHKEKLEPLVQVGASIDDLTPKGLWNTQYHIISISEDQLAALKKLYGESSYQDITPKIASKAAAISGGFLYCRGGKIPNDIKVRGRHLSQSYETAVRGGKVWLNQKAYDSPSKA